VPLGFGLENMRAVEAAINVTKQRTSEWIRNTSNSAISMLENPPSI
jgi:hypothetical protein